MFKFLTFCFFTVGSDLVRLSGQNFQGSITVQSHRPVYKQRLVALYQLKPQMYPSVSLLYQFSCPSKLVWNGRTRGGRKKLQQESSSSGSQDRSNMCLVNRNILFLEKIKLNHKTIFRPPYWKYFWFFFVWNG